MRRLLALPLLVLFCSPGFAKEGPPDMARIEAISAEHGIFFVTD